MVTDLTHDLRHTEFELYKLITWQLKTTGVCRWSNEGFAKKLHKGITTVRDALRRLRIKGILFIEARSGSTNLYTLKKPTPCRKPTPIIDIKNNNKKVSIRQLVDKITAGDSPEEASLLAHAKANGYSDHGAAYVMVGFLSHWRDNKPHTIMQTFDEWYAWYKNYVVRSIMIA